MLEKKRAMWFPRAEVSEMEMMAEWSVAGGACRSRARAGNIPTWGRAAERTPSWRQVDAELRRIARRRAALDAEEARWLLRARDERVHVYLGFGTFLEYLERVLGHSPKVAVERLRVAEALVQLPAVTAALEDGRLAYSAVRELTRVASPETERAWLEATRDRTLREIEPMVAGRKPGDLPGAAPDPDLVEHRVSFVLSAETHALLREALRLVRDQAGGYLSDDEAVGQLARAVLGGPTDAGRASYQIALTVCARCDGAEVHGGGERKQVAPEVLERARCDAQEIGRLDGDAPERATQTIPPAIRRLVMHRDGGRCVVPGCRSSRYLDVHHLRFRSNGGDHAPHNLACMCFGHHHQVHAGRLIVTGQAPQLGFWHADGRPYGAAPPRAVAGGAIEPDDPVFADVTSALVNLGYRPAQARAAVTSVRPHVGAAPSLEVVVRAALKALRPPAA